MRQKLCFLFVTCVLVFNFPVELSAYAQPASQGVLGIQSPRSGEAVQGLVQIIGTVDAANMLSYEVAFAFSGGPTQTWFRIASGNEPIIQGVLGEWDTTVLTDSTYDLLLRVHTQDGNASDVIVEDIRVRNYSTIETATPAPTSAGGNQDAAPTPIRVTTSPLDLEFTPTAFPPNPAAVDTDQVTRAIKRGAIFGAVMIGGVLLYTRTKRRTNKS